MFIIIAFSSQDLLITNATTSTTTNATTTATTTTTTTATAVEPIYSDHSWSASSCDHYNSIIFAEEAKPIKHVAVTRRIKDLRIANKKTESKECMQEVYMSHTTQ